MTKIISRLNEDEAQLRRLRNILEVATGGAIAPGGDVEPAQGLHDLVTQVDMTCASLLETLDHVDAKYHQLALDNLRLATKIAEQDATLSTLHAALEDGISYDEDLDHATIDMMDTLLASGVAEPTFDGEICFQPEIPVSCEDLKPIVRETIESWLRLKVK